MPATAHRDLEAKMTECIEEGVRLGWPIDPQNESMTASREDGSAEVLQKPQTLSGEVDPSRIRV